ncbi:beta-propeller fold lactonase family protein [Candidatus Dependentiae bacterium]|nr:beta-propeller fold lactonase family protein [Candidatus Dependentiae bacterium]
MKKTLVLLLLVFVFKINHCFYDRDDQVVAVKKITDLAVGGLAAKIVSLKRIALIIVLNKDKNSLTTFQEDVNNQENYNQRVYSTGGKEAIAFTVSPDELCLAVLHKHSERINFFSIEEDGALTPLESSISIDKDASNILFAPHNNLLVVLSKEKNMLTTISLTNGYALAEKTEYFLPDNPMKAVFSAQGKVLVISYKNIKQLTCFVVDENNNLTIAEKSEGDSYSAIYQAPDYTLLGAVLNQSPYPAEVSHYEDYATTVSLLMWDQEKGLTPLYCSNNEGFKALLVNFSPHKKYSVILYAKGLKIKEGYILVLGLKDLKSIQQVASSTYKENPLAAAFSYDDRYLAIAHKFVSTTLFEIDDATLLTMHSIASVDLANALPRDIIFDSKGYSFYMLNLHSDELTVFKIKKQEAKIVLFFSDKAVITQSRFKLCGKSTTHNSIDFFANGKYLGKAEPSITGFFELKNHENHEYSDGTYHISAVIMQGNNVRFQIKALVIINTKEETADTSDQYSTREALNSKKKSALPHKLVKAKSLTNIGVVKSPQLRRANSSSDSLHKNLLKSISEVEAETSPSLAKRVMNLFGSSKAEPTSDSFALLKRSKSGL